MADESKGFAVDLNSVIEFPKKGIFSKLLAKSDSYNYSVMCLSKGEGIDTHTSTRNGAVYVMRGKGIFRLFDREIELKPGVFISMPKDAPHSLEAHENLAILLLLAG